MNLIEFVRETFKTEGYYHRPRVICNDGFIMSVQGGTANYSSPRKNCSMFSSMEIGFPSEKEILIMKFAEDKGNPTGTVYGWVDVDVIQSVIDKHGGISVSKTFSSYIP
jgi:hypothetical protein